MNKLHIDILYLWVNIVILLDSNNEMKKKVGLLPLYPWIGMAKNIPLNGMAPKIVDNYRPATSDPPIPPPWFRMLNVLCPIDSRCSALQFEYQKLRK